MLRINIFFKALLQYPVENNVSLAQQVRWYRPPRKPFWIGKAKSKIFRIPKVVYQPIEEKEELQKLNNIYMTKMRSIRYFLMHEKTSTDEISALAQKNAVSDEEIEASLKVNAEWNTESALLREARLLKTSEEHEHLVIVALEKRENLKLQIQAKVSELVQIEKEKSETFITSENIDKAIDECLATTQDFNYAIDLEGKIHKKSDNESGKPPEIEMKENVMRQ